MARPASLVLSLVVAATVAAAASCSSDPVQSSAVKALGPEEPGIEPGEYHRAGQPCVVCHQSGGPGKGEFSIAGTIFLNVNQPDGVENVEVRLTDALGEKRFAKTNCVGNFFIGRKDVYLGIPPWEPAYPVTVAVSKGGTDRKMLSLINRDGSCAGCHRLPQSLDAPQSLDSPGIVYLGGDPNTAAPECAVSPTVPIKTGGE